MTPGGRGWGGGGGGGGGGALEYLSNSCSRWGFGMNKIVRVALWVCVCV